MHVFYGQLTSLLFLTLLSETCQTSINAWFVFSHVCWVLKRLPGCKVSHGLVVIFLLTFNYFLSHFKHQWIHNTYKCNYTACVFPATCGFPPPPYVVLVNRTSYVSKMTGNSASKPLKIAPTELPCITID